MRIIFTPTIVCLLCAMSVIFSSRDYAGANIGEKEHLSEKVVSDVPMIASSPLELKIQTMQKNIGEKKVLSEADIGLIALVTMAEAEGECESGKRLVIDTILNRMDSEYFPDSVYEVIYQPNQFSSMWNGRVSRCEVREDICQLVREELGVRMDKEVMFFTAGRYSNYGVPMFQVGNHYFSSYN